MTDQISLIRVEWFKLRSTPALAVATGCTVGLAVFAGTINVLLAGQKGLPELGTPENAAKVLAVGAATSVAMLILGIIVGAGEHRDRTVIGTMLGEPRRGRVVVAKLVGVGVVGAAVGALTFGATYAVAVPLFAFRGVHTLPIDVGGLVFGTILASACYGVLGVALGTLTRNLMASIVCGLIWVNVVEIAILQPLLPTVAKWLPTGAAVALTTLRHPGDHQLAPVVAALVLVGWGVVISAAAMRTSVRREVR